MAPRTPAEMAVDHAALLKGIDANTMSIDKAVWMVDLMLSERIKLNADQQEAYVAAMTKQFPEAINKLSTIQGIGLERSKPSFLYVKCTVSVLLTARRCKCTRCSQRSLGHCDFVFCR